MWYFLRPRIYFGEDALSQLEELTGRLAFIVTDANMERLGFVHLVQQRLHRAGIASAVFAEVEPEPSIETVRRAAAAMAGPNPDWVIGLGGGSCMDAAKAAWLLYERPDVDPAAINPFDSFGLRAKARLITIPTTSGTGAEVNWMVMLTDAAAGRKIGVGARELVADISIVDPVFVGSLPPSLTADTGMDMMTHAVEAYVNTAHNDFADALALKAAQLGLTYLPRAYANGGDQEARVKMHNAATLAGLAMSNSWSGFAHAMGHAITAIFHVPHGRAVALFLPYLIEFTANGGESRYAEFACFLGLPAKDDAEGTASLVTAIRDLQRALAMPTSLRDLGISSDSLAHEMAHLTAHVETGVELVMSPRLPDHGELTRLFEYAYDGRKIDF